MTLAELTMDERTADAIWGAGIIVVLVVLLLVSMFWGRDK